jgi:arginine/lysine/histidine transporter system substrate-binding protein
MSGSLAKKLGMAFAVLGILVLGGCFPKKKDTAINLLVTKDSPPYSSKSEDSESIAGFEIDLLKHIAQKMGKELNIKASDVPSILSSLGSLSADCGVIGTPIAQARKQHYAMSTPYATAKLVVLARKGRNISSVADLFSKALGVLSGSVAEDAAAKISAQVFGLVVKPLQNNDTLISELLGDGVDAVIADYLQAKNFASEHQSSLYVACDVPESMYESLDLCILLPKDSALKSKMDKVINEMKGDGSLDALRDLWLKPAEEQIISKAE